MQTRSFLITPQQAIVFSDTYNALVSSGQYTHSPSASFMAGHEIPYVTTLLEEYSKSGNSSYAVGDGTAVFLKGPYGTIAIYRHGYRRKLTLIAPDSFWDVAPDAMLDMVLFKFIVKSNYMDASKSTVDFNLDRSTPLLNW